jgi:hypothetical protein
MFLGCRGVGLYRRRVYERKFLTVGALANILVIHEKVIRLIGPANLPSGVLGTSVLLQGNDAESLHWNDSTLRTFLEGTIRSKFGVHVTGKNIRKTINGTAATIGDLSIAISAAIQRQQRPRKAVTYGAIQGRT